MKARKARTELLISGLVSSVPSALVTSNGTTIPRAETGHRHVEHGSESSKTPTTMNAMAIMAMMCRREALFMFAEVDGSAGRSRLPDHETRSLGEP